MEIDITLTLSIIATIGTTITTIVLIFTYLQDKKRDMPQFDFSSIWLNEKPYSLNIQNPTKPIDNCQIFCNGVALETPFGGHFIKGIYIHAGGSAQFFLPKNLSEKDNPKILVKDGKSTLKKKKLQEIPHKF